MIEEFIEYMLYNLGLSMNTWDSYQYALTTFWRFIKRFKHNIDKPESITYEDINKRVLSQKGLNNKTINTRLCSIRRYLKWCKDLKNIDCIDWNKILSLKEEDTSVWYFSEIEKRKILKLVDDWYWNSEEIKLRNRLLIYILMFTWLRIQEALNLKTKDVKESVPIIWKWKHLRYTFLRPELLDLAQEYIDKKKHYSDYLFSTVWNSKHSKVWMQLNQTTTAEFFIKISKILWFHVHAHKFRHTYATSLLHLKGSNIYNIAKLLWHKNIATTQIYLWCDDQELKKLNFALKI